MEIENLQNIVEKADKIEKVYEADIYEYSEKISTMIYKSLNRSLEHLCQKEKVVTSNSVYKELFPFSIIYRVKKPESLKEKMIRKSLYKDIYDLNEDNISENIQNKVDDLIEITILVDTNKNLDVFANFIFEGKVAGVKAISDIEKSKPKFGDLPYYNIKAEYNKNKVNVLIEIQIKSTIVSAFTNIQHKLIYKNRDVSIMKNNNDEMIKAITPTVNAIENVIDSVEQSFVSAEREIEIYYRQKKIQELISDNSKDAKIFDVFIKDITEIIDRSIEGYIIKKNKTNLNKEKLEEQFWEEFRDKNGKIILKFEKEDLVLNLLAIIGAVNKDFIDNLVYFDYFYFNNLQEKDHSDSTYSEQVVKNIDLITFLSTNKTKIYENLLLDNKQSIIDIIESASTITTDFLDENEDENNEIDNELKKIVIQAAVLFMFQDSDDFEVKEMNDAFINTDFLEQELKKRKR